MRNETKGRVLFISPAFFGYEIAIKEAIIENGYEVDYFDERTSNNSFIKAVFRVRKTLLTQLIKGYYEKILLSIRDKRYKYFLLIKGEVIPEWFILKFKKNNPGVRLVYYSYDSINNNNNNSITILKHFDSCYSFDFEDVSKYPFLKLKHLFYSKEYAVPLNSERKYSISFVGTLHSNRYKVIKHVFKNFDNSFAFFFSPAKWHFFLDKLLKKEYRNIGWAEVSFDKLSGKQVADIFKSSYSVLDIQRFGQSGLTMRTFEVLASGAILITTNAYIKKTDFYNHDNIIVLDNIDADNVSEVVARKISGEKVLTNPIGEAFSKYYVVNWVKEFFD